MKGTVRRMVLEMIQAIVEQMRRASTRFLQQGHGMRSSSHLQCPSSVQDWDLVTISCDHVERGGLWKDSSHLLL